MMPDREKIIKHFEHLLNAAKGNYQDFVDLTVDVGEDILDLLKDQKAELSYRKAKSITHTATKLDDVTCPSCGNVVRMRYDYCHYCGQKLDWEGR